MKLLNESLSSEVYHFTSLFGLRKMLEDGKIRMSEVDKNSSDDLLNKGYTHYLSFTRSYNSLVGYAGRTNRYKFHNRTGWENENTKLGNKNALLVRLVFDGDALSSKYKAGPVDFLQKQFEKGPAMAAKYDDEGHKVDWFTKALGINYEDNPLDAREKMFKYYQDTEDRIFSNDDSLDLDKYLKRVDVLIPNSNLKQIMAFIYKILTDKKIKENGLLQRLAFFTSVEDFNNKKCTNYMNQYEMLKKCIYFFKSNVKDFVKNGEIESLSDKEKKYKEEECITDSNLYELSRLLYSICFNSKNVESAIVKKMIEYGLNVNIVVITSKDGYDEEGNKIKKTGRKKKDDPNLLYTKTNMCDAVLEKIKTENFDSKLNFEEVKNFYRSNRDKLRYGDFSTALERIISDWLVIYKRTVKKKCKEFYDDLENAVMKFNKNSKKNKGIIQNTALIILQVFEFLSENILNEIYQMISDGFISEIVKELGLSEEEDKYTVTKVILQNRNKITRHYANTNYQYNEIFLFQKELYTELNGGSNMRVGSKLGQFFNGNNRMQNAYNYMSTMKEGKIRGIIKNAIHESAKNMLKEDYHAPRPFPQEIPEPFRRIVVKDKNGEYQGHLSTPIVWDGERFVSDLAHYMTVDPNNIVEWQYINEI